MRASERHASLPLGHGKVLERRSSSLTMDIRNPRGVTSPFLDSRYRLGCQMEGYRVNGKGSSPCRSRLSKPPRVYVVGAAGPPRPSFIMRPNNLCRAPSGHYAEPPARVRARLHRIILFRRRAEGGVCSFFINARAEYNSGPPTGPGHAVVG
ncbi:hypothetical protein EVAR_7280_1 [Eumeta japonica]|uniref:Uncharacterized protein n=1 Tax=Eumeta variegata TaxID=151549 RepID=A0A4C1T2N7_EUMVA|nr:hypothetical protein EVAR_7280_1 [Eumeta japonica]